LYNPGELYLIPTRKAEDGFGISDLLFRNRAEDDLGEAIPQTAITFTSDF
jgi:hypothetical protein